MEESAPLQYTVISLVSGCRSIIDMHFLDESNGNTFRISNSKTLFPKIEYNYTAPIQKSKFKKKSHIFMHRTGEYKQQIIRVKGMQSMMTVTHPYCIQFSIILISKRTGLHFKLEKYTYQA